MEFVPEAHRWARWFVTILFPSSCLTCSNDVSFEEGPICPPCIASIDKRPAFRKTGALDHCVSIGPFTGKLKELIHLYKYSGKDYLARVLADLVIKQWPIAPFGAQALTSVPMPYWRQFWRGYNQAFLLAEELGRRWQLPVIKGGIGRRSNRSQTRLSRENRLKNAQKGFRASGKKINGHECILLVDDVLTTGATLEVCASLLKTSGAKTVSALTLAYD